MYLIICYSAMLEPRYALNNGHGTGARLIESNNLDTAVDLSRKTAAVVAAAAAAAAVADNRLAHDHDHEAEDSDEEAPLDLKVRPAVSSKPAFPGFPLPDSKQRAELLRIAELYTSGVSTASSTPLPQSSRDSSQESRAGKKLIKLI